MRVFLAATSLRPGYGGPAHSIARLASALAGGGADVGLWAADQSATATTDVADDSRVRRLTGSAEQAMAQFGPVDVLHDNGVWLPHNHRLAAMSGRLGIPRIVSTRGMLEPWALHHKRIKKKLAWWMYQRRDLRRAHLLHATADLEAGNLERLDLGAPICAIPNGVDMPVIAPGDRVGFAAASRSDGRRTALFLGRLYPVKGLPMLIEAWRSLRPNGWRLSIAGPDEAGHRAVLERAVAEAGLQDVISFAGMLVGERKRQALLGADLFVLPSHSESFGLAIGEALAHGLPVLTTTATPWSGLSARGCGWQVAPAAPALAAALREATSKDDGEMRSMGARGRDWMAAEFTWGAVAARFLTTYRQMMGGTMVNRGGFIHSP